MIEKNIPLCNQLSVRPCVYKIDRIWSNVSPHRPTSRQQTNCRLIVCGKWHKARFPYFDVIRGITMLAKMTSKNQLTLPKNITAAVGPAEYFDVEAQRTDRAHPGADPAWRCRARQTGRAGSGRARHRRCGRMGEKIARNQKTRPCIQKVCEVMSRSKRIPRVVIDANLVLSALVFAHGRLSPLRLAWQGGASRWLQASLSQSLSVYSRTRNSNSPQKTSKSCLPTICLTALRYACPPSCPLHPIDATSSTCRFCNSPSRAKRTIWLLATRIC